jgi:hypothetical protein
MHRKTPALLLTLNLPVDEDHWFPPLVMSDHGYLRCDPDKVKNRVPVHPLPDGVAPEPDIGYTVSSH